MLLMLLTSSLLDDEDDAALLELVLALALFICLEVEEGRSVWWLCVMLVILWGMIEGDQS